MRDVLVASAMIGLMSARFVPLAVLLGLAVAPPAEAVAQEERGAGSGSRLTGGLVAPFVEPLRGTGSDRVDLGPIADAIGDARMVLIGEQTHSDGATLALRNQLVRYLHEERGFDVLMFEAGGPTVRRQAQALRSGRAVQHMLTDTTTRIWVGRANRPSLDLFRYVQATQRTGAPIEIVGYDINYFFAPRLADTLLAFLGAVPDVLTAAQGDTLRRALAPLTSGRPIGPETFRTVSIDSTDVEVFRQFMGRLLANVDGCERAFVRRYGARRFRMQRRVLQNLPAFYSLASVFFGVSPSNAPYLARDPVSGANLVWLADSIFPDRKIIVTGAAFHLIRSGTADAPEHMQAMATMGETLRRSRDDVYMLGFTSGSGWRGQESAPDTIDAPPAGSLDAALDAQGHAYAFIDLQRAKAAESALDDRFVARFLGHTPMLARWAALLDGAIHVRAPRTVPALPE